MHRWPLAIALLVIAAPTLVGCSVGRHPEQPPCAEDGFATFGSDPSLPTCGTGYRFEAEFGRPVARVYAHLPAVGPYGSGERRHSLGLSLRGFDGGSPTGGVEIRRDPATTSLGDPTTLRGWGDCTGSALQPRLLVACDIELYDDAARTTLTLELPALPDPDTDPGLVWLEVTYRFEGEYAAAATVRSAVTANSDVSVAGLTIALADGAIVVVDARAEDPRRVASLRFPLDGPGEPGQVWRPDSETPSLGGCTVTTDPTGMNGSLECRTAGGSTTVVMTWRTLP